MAGKWEGKEYRIVWHPKGFPHLSPHSGVAARCGIHFTLDQSWFKREDCMNKEQFNHRIPPLCFHFPNMGERWNERRENSMKKLQPSKEMFDINLDWEGGVRSQMCVFVIKQVWIFHLRQKAFFVSWQTLWFTVVFLLHHHRHPVLPPPCNDLTLS